MASIGVPLNRWRVTEAGTNVGVDSKCAEAQMANRQACVGAGFAFIKMASLTALVTWYHVPKRPSIASVMRSFRNPGLYTRGLLACCFYRRRRHAIGASFVPVKLCWHSAVTLWHFHSMCRWSAGSGSGTMTPVTLSNRWGAK